MAFSPVVRQANIAHLQREQVDVLVVGGGISGAGVAREAALRGLAVALLEKDDFASGTSSKSARLVHGGFRYLEQYQFGLVASACAERHKLRRIAPRLVRPLAFTLPIYRDSNHSLLKIRLGMWLYDLLALLHNVRRHRILRPGQVAAVEPALAQRGLVGAVYYYDCLADDARLTLATVQAAHRHGARVANHAEVCGLVKAGGKVAGAEVLDRITGQRFSVRAKVTVNATGVWADGVRQMDDPAVETLIRVNRGSHLVLPRDRLGVHGAVSFASADGQRAMYLVPWGETCLVGTTDVDHGGELDRVYATPPEVEAMLAAVNHAFPAARLTPDDIVSTFAGLRPLIGGGQEAAYQVSRDHHIFESEAGLVTLAGGKLTTYRRMAQDLVDFVTPRLGARGRSRSAQQPLLEAAFDAEGEAARLAARYPQLERDVVAHVVSAYGPAATTLLAPIEEEAEMGCRIVPGLPYIWAEVPYAVQHEMALTLSDFMVRRTHIIHEDKDQGTACAAEVAAAMARELGWDSAEVERQMRAYDQQVALTRAFR